MFEYIKNLIESYRDRLKNPILGAYSASFILCNWRPMFILLFSKSSIEDRIKVIDSKYSFWSAILWPILVSFIIVLVVPYVMMLLELAVSKASKFRREIRYTNSIDNYNHKIIIASKEFEIQNQKSGTRTVEMLQSNIDSLEHDKENLINQLNLQRTNDSNEIEKFKELLKLEKEKNDENMNDDNLGVPAKVFETFNHLESSGRLEEFYTNYDYFAAFQMNSDLIKFYRDLGLMTYRDTTYSFTQLADSLYHFLFELYFSKDVKKRFKSIIEKLNNHEVSTLRNYGHYNNRAISLEGFNQKLVADLEEYGFVERIENGSYFLTTEGLKLRNVMGILLPS